MRLGVRRNLKNNLLLSPIVLPMVFFLLSVMVIFSIWNKSNNIRVQSLEHETAITAEQIKLRLEQWIDSRTAILEYLGSSWESLSQLGEEPFPREATQIMDLYPGFQAINLIDLKWVIRIVVPEATNQAALNKDLHLHPDPAVGLALKAALATDAIKRSPMIRLLQGKPGFATYFPAYDQHGALIGTINGVFVMADVMNHCLSEEKLQERYSIRITTLNNELVYAHNPEGFPEDFQSKKRGLEVRIVDKDWRLFLTPLALVNHPVLLTGEGLLMIGSFFLDMALSLLLRAYLFRLRELKESQENYKLLVDNQADMIIKMDTDHRITFGSPSAIKKIGVPEEGFLGKRTSEFTHPDDLNILQQFIDELNSGLEPDDLIVRMQKTDGWMWTSWSGSNIFNSDGLKTGRVSVGRDITLQREMENRLRQGQKLQAVGQLAGGVAHDFNNIIQAILGYLGFVKLNLSPESEAFQDLTQAELAAERAATLTRQLLAFSRRQILQPVLLDLDRVTSELMPMLSRLLGESINLEFTPGTTNSSVMADRGQLEQILVNLCVNARDAIDDENGSITIETSEVSFDENYCKSHQWAETGNWLRLSLTDSGHGMDESVLGQIFEPFFTTKETGKGTGLGLATVYGIIKQHEGLVDVTSQPGQGTCFSLYLKSVDAVVYLDQVSQLETTHSGAETILLAEDEDMVRELTQRILEKAGYTVFSAENGQKAVDIWNERKFQFDLVVLDVVMPVMGGREVFQKIRQNKDDAKVLFISGYDSESFRKPLSASEPVDVLIKPFKREKLLNRVRDILDR
jgi:PAS domain S-box-containing protein